MLQWGLADYTVSIAAHREENKSVNQIADLLWEIWLNFSSHAVISLSAYLNLFLHGHGLQKDHESLHAKAGFRLNHK